MSEKSLLKQQLRLDYEANKQLGVVDHLIGSNIKRHQMRMEEILMTDGTLSECEEQIVVEAEMLIAQQSVRKKQRKFEEKKNKEEGAKRTSRWGVSLRTISCDVSDSLRK